MSTITYVPLDTLVGVCPVSSRGWYCFFEDAEDPEAPFWGEMIECWGEYDVAYSEDPAFNKIELHALRILEETGGLDGDFVNAPNFLGVIFSRPLADIAQSHSVSYAEICQVPLLLTCLEKICAARRRLSEEEEAGNL